MFKDEKKITSNREPIDWYMVSLLVAMVILAAIFIYVEDV